jgi:hypothetical protein
MEEEYGEMADELQIELNREKVYVADLEAEVERLRAAFDTAIAEARAGNRDSMMYALRHLHGDVLAESLARIDNR